MPTAVQFHAATRQLLVQLDGPVFGAPHAAALEGELLGYLDQPIDAVSLDFGRVEDIDSEAVQALAHLRGRLASSAERGRFALENASPAVRSVLDLLGWERLFRIADAASVADAGAASSAS